MAVGLVCAAVATGCSVDRSIDPPLPTAQLSTPSPTESFSGFDSFRSEYLQAADTLSDTLPPGRVFTEEPPGTWDETGSYEVGTGRVTAVLFWRCAWATAYVDATEGGDTVGAARALDKLGAWATMPDVVAHSDEDARTKWMERVVGPAESGEDSSLRLIESDCSGG
ncbi:MULTISPECIES: hypothetical protein [Microbacterium]|uniref:hypothetical protein n=1 Tax=Microbacterium TaxID=33882 RepID=UPI0011AEF83A|nr:MULTISPECIES: hypothetical protein [Microbacterium]